tara:strand:+ start:32544 stop:33371 length:828 start_codon:yes stop_codon:yes gene_type:complete
MKPYLTVKDYMVSGEKFELYEIPKMEMLQTLPIPKNLDKYYESTSYISHTDAKRSFIDKLYQLIKQYSLYKKRLLIDKYAHPQKNILDIGAGTGDFLKHISQRGWNVAGIEPNAAARQKAAQKGIHLKTEYSELGTTKYDVITLWHVLEHLPNLEDHIKEIKTRITLGGTLIVAVPNYRSYDAQYYGAYWAAYDVPRHLHHFSQKSITLLFKKYSINVIKVKPMIFDSFYVSLLSEKYKTGKNNYFRAVYIGLLSNIKAIKNKEHSSLIYVLKNI